MDKQRYAAVQAEALRRIAARKMIAQVLEADRQAETMTPNDLRAAGWFVGGVDELMERIRAACDERDPDHG